MSVDIATVFLISGPVSRISEWIGFCCAGDGSAMLGGWILGCSRAFCNLECFSLADLCEVFAIFGRSNFVTSRSSGVVGRFRRRVAVGWGEKADEF